MPIRSPCRPVRRGVFNLHSNLHSASISSINMAYGVHASLAGVLFVFFVSWISGFLRFYVRFRLVKAFKLDDWLALVAMVRTIYIPTLNLTADHWKVGVHCSSDVVLRRTAALWP